MSKITLIIQREYLTRVKKKSFIIMTLVGPLLMAGLIFARVWLEMIPEDPKKIEVIDESIMFKGKLENSKNLLFYFPNSTLTNAKADFYTDDYDILVFIPENIIDSHSIQLFYKKQPGLTTQDNIKNLIQNKLEDWKLIASGIDKNKLESVKTKLNVIANKLQKTGEEEKSNNEAGIIIGFVGGLLIYLFIFLYGAQVMRGVIEEKTSRIIEVIISSVKPFELMMGKIIGIALVGLTQFLLWVILTITITSVVSNTFLEKKYDSTTVVEQTYKSNTPTNVKEDMNKPDLGEVGEMLQNINLPVILGCFIFYFLGGYLLYGSLFAAIGSAVDSEADTQQFMMPVTIPLIFSFVAAQVVVTNPESPMAFWFSIIPLTSPIVMMVRLPFGVPYYEIILSMVLLVLGFIGTTWLAAKIYRTGILMYGKKPTYKELWKWLFYKA